jgi:hypothetical protein
MLERLGGVNHEVRQRIGEAPGDFLGDHASWNRVLAAQIERAFVAFETETASIGTDLASHASPESLAAIAEFSKHAGYLLSRSSFTKVTFEADSPDPDALLEQAHALVFERIALLSEGFQRQEMQAASPSLVSPTERFARQLSAAFDDASVHEARVAGERRAALAEIGAALDAAANATKNLPAREMSSRIDETIDSMRADLSGARSRMIAALGVSALPESQRADAIARFNQIIAETRKEVLSVELDLWEGFLNWFIPEAYEYDGRSIDGSRPVDVAPFRIESARGERES